MAKKWDVFVSYATKDSRSVSHVVSDLESSGLSVWQDVSAIQPGSRIREAINEGIQSSKSFLVFLSKRSTKSRWVLNELDAAMVQEINNQRNFVIMVLLGNIAIDEIPADIQGKRFIDLRYNFQHKYLAQRTMVPRSRP